MLYVAAGLLIGEIFSKFNIRLGWGLVCVPLFIVISKLSKNTVKNFLLMFLLFFIFFLWGHYLYGESVLKIHKYDGYKNGEIYEIKGKIVNICKDGEIYKIEVKMEKGGEKILCCIEEIQSLKMGMLITVKGEKSDIKAGSNFGEFDLKNYYNSKEIYMVLKNCRVERTSKEYSEILQFFYIVGEKIKATINQSCPEEEAGTLNAILLGDRNELSSEIKDLYTMSGLGHILSLSGMHMSLVWGILYGIFRKRFRQPSSVVLSAIIMICFVCITGAGVSTVRAAIMYMIKMISEVVGRRYDMKNGAAISLVIILVDNPLYINNAGFILSFLSVTGIAFIAPSLREIFLKNMEKGRKRKVAEALIITAVLYFTTGMAVAYIYYEIPVYAIILNLLLLPLMSIMVICGFAGALIYMVFIPPGEVILYVSTVILKIYKLVCKLFLALPLSTCATGSKTMLEVITFYVILAAGVCFCRLLSYKGIKKIIVAVGAVFICMSVVLLIHKKDYSFVVGVLYVGQGECIYVESPGGTNYLIDCGSIDENKIAEYKLEPFLKYMGRDKIDVVFVTHTDKDHVSGIIELLEQDKVKVGRVVFGNCIEEDNELYNCLLKLVKERNIKLKYMSAGDTIKDKYISFLCINPIKDMEYSDANEASTVLYCSYKEFDFLFTGDIGQDTEKFILNTKYGELLSDISLLKVAHHGSKSASGEEWIKHICSKMAVISCGKNNSYGHPHSEVLERMRDNETDIFVTSECGMVMVYEKNGGLCVKCVLK